MVFGLRVIINYKLLVVESGAVQESLQQGEEQVFCLADAVTNLWRNLDCFILYRNFRSVIIRRALNLMDIIKLFWRTTALLEVYSGLLLKLQPMFHVFLISTLITCRSVTPIFFRACGIKGPDHNAVPGGGDSERFRESRRILPSLSYLIKSDQLNIYKDDGH